MPSMCLRPSLVALAVLGAISAGCAPTSMLAVDVDASGLGGEQLVLELREGGCAGPPMVGTVRVVARDEGIAPYRVGAGTYGVAVTVLGAGCVVVGEACVTAADHAVLRPSPISGEVDCRGAGCCTDAGPFDAGAPGDAGDAGDGGRDAPDAAAPDAGTDAGCPFTDTGAACVEGTECLPSFCEPERCSPECSPTGTMVQTCYDVLCHCGACVYMPHEVSLGTSCGATELAPCGDLDCTSRCEAGECVMFRTGCGALRECIDGVCIRSGTGTM